MRSHLPSGLQDPDRSPIRVAPPNALRLIVVVVIYSRREGIRGAPLGALRRAALLQSNRRQRPAFLGHPPTAQYEMDALAALYPDTDSSSTHLVGRWRRVGDVRRPRDLPDSNGRGAHPDRPGLRPTCRTDALL